MLLSYVDNLSKTLQNKSTSAAEGQQVDRMVIDTISTLRTDRDYDLFWKKLNKAAQSHDIDEPHVP